jgi:hypothetical protein
VCTYNFSYGTRCLDFWGDAAGDPNQPKLETKLAIKLDIKSSSCAWLDLQLGFLGSSLTSNFASWNGSWSSSWSSSWAPNFNFETPYCSAFVCITKYSGSAQYCRNILIYINRIASAGQKYDTEKYILNIFKYIWIWYGLGPSHWIWIRVDMNMNMNMIWI